MIPCKGCSLTLYEHFFPGTVDPYGLGSGIFHTFTNDGSQENNDLSLLQLGNNVSSYKCTCSNQSENDSSTLAWFHRFLGWWYNCETIKYKLGLLNNRIQKSNNFIRNPLTGVDELCQLASHCYVSQAHSQANNFKCGQFLPLAF